MLEVALVQPRIIVTLCQRHRTHEHQQVHVCVLNKHPVGAKISMR